MANITQGQFIGFLPYGLASARKDPMRNSLGYQSWSARYFGNQLTVGGDKTASGRTFVSGAPVPRTVVIMTQPPRAQIVFESNTVLPGAPFSFPKLAAGRYVVIDTAPDSGQQGLIYDWVVPV